MDARSIVVTGCSSGTVRDAAFVLRRRNRRVFASSLAPRLPGNGSRGPRQPCHRRRGRKLDKDGAGGDARAHGRNDRRAVQQRRKCRAGRGRGPAERPPDSRAPPRCDRSRRSRFRFRFHPPVPARDMLPRPPPAVTRSRPGTFRFPRQKHGGGRGLHSTERFRRYRADAGHRPWR